MERATETDPGDRRRSVEQERRVRYRPDGTVEETLERARIVIERSHVARPTSLREGAWLNSVVATVGVHSAAAVALFAAALTGGWLGISVYALLLLGVFGFAMGTWLAAVSLATLVAMVLTWSENAPAGALVTGGLVVVAAGIYTFLCAIQQEAE